MCGIIGSLYRKSSNFETHSVRMNLLKRMIKSVIHRGPDAQAYYTDNHCYLGFTRLAFVGGPTSMQPLSNENKSLYLICNGEIYNYKELKRGLERKGHRFSTFSDCEVILHLYEEFGKKTVGKLQGQFAFVLWDKNRKQIFATRDRFGICPLFYCKAYNNFIFASEMKAIFEDSMISPILDPQGLAETAFIYSPTPPNTCFENIKRIPPAYSLSIDLKSWRIDLEQYWHLPLIHKKSIKGSDDINKLKKGLKEKLEKVVTTYTNHGDEPVAVSISGGIDSSALGYFSKNTPGRINTSFGIKFSDQQFDESYFQRKLAKFLGFKHHEMYCDDRLILKTLPQVIWHTESPLFRTAAIPLFTFSKFISEAGFKTILSGEGADELFCGYPIFLEGEIRAIFLNNKSEKRAKKDLEGFLQQEVSLNEFQKMKREYQTNPKIIPGFPSHYSRWKATKKLLSLFKKNYLREGADRIALRSLRTFMGNNQEEITNLGWAQHAEIITKQEGYILSSQGDRVFMAHAVEKRLPYLGEEIASFALQINEDLRQHGVNDKYILRKMMEGLLPKKIVHRPKQGYLAPNDTPFSQNKTKGSYVEELLSDRMIKKSGYFKPEMVRDISSRLNTLCKEKDRKFIESAFVFILTTQVLHHLFIEKNKGLLSN